MREKKKEVEIKVFHKKKPAKKTTMEIFGREKERQKKKGDCDKKGLLFRIIMFDENLQN